MCVGVLKYEIPIIDNDKGSIITWPCPDCGNRQKTAGEYCQTCENRGRVICISAKDIIDSIE